MGRGVYILYNFMLGQTIALSCEESTTHLFILRGGIPMKTTRHADPGGDVEVAPTEDTPGTLKQQDLYGNAFMQEQVTAASSVEPVDIAVVDNQDIVGMLDNLMHWGAVTGAASISDMVTKINEARGEAPINTLEIYGHAQPGMQIIGEQDGFNVGLSASGVQQHEKALKTIDFASGGRAELHGCKVAQGKSGDNLLTALSSVWGVSVSGGVEVQRLLPGLEGTTKTANPDGSIDINEDDAMF